jgi:hypothetical protein
MSENVENNQSHQGSIQTSVGSIGRAFTLAKYFLRDREQLGIGVCEFICISSMCNLLTSYLDL